MCSISLVAANAVRHEEKSIEHKRGGELNISGCWRWCIDRALRINRGFRANTVFTSLCSRGFNREKWPPVCNFTLYTSLHAPPPLFSVAPIFLSFLTLVTLSFSLSARVFSSVTRGLVGDEPMSAVGRVGGTEERGVEEGEEGWIKRRYGTLTCFGLIRAGCFVLKPLALIWEKRRGGGQHLELIITHYSRAAAYCYYIHPKYKLLWSLCAATHCYRRVGTALQ